MLAQIKRLCELPVHDRYLCGIDLSLSGFGPFAPDDDPHRLTSYVGEVVNTYDYVMRKSLCPVIFPLETGDDVDILLLNCRVNDVLTYPADHCCIYYLNTIYEPMRYAYEKLALKMLAARNMREEVFEDTLDSFLESIGNRRFDDRHNDIAYFFDKFKNAPFIVVRSRDTAWYTEPGLGNVYEANDGTRFKFCHPTDRPKRGDYEVWPTGLRWDNIAIRKVTSQYVGTKRRYKAILAD